MSEKLKMQMMLDSSVAFFLAGERCTPDFGFGVYPSHTVNGPVIMNYTFGLELGLKLLNLCYKRKVTGHNLFKIFSKLPTQGRRFLEDTIYLQWLKDIQNDFSDWRYAYEKVDLYTSTDETRRLFILVHNETRRLKPELVSVYEKQWGIFEPDWDWAWAEQELRDYKSIPDE